MSLTTKQLKEIEEYYQKKEAEQIASGTISIINPGLKERMQALKPKNINLISRNRVKKKYIREQKNFCMHCKGPCSYYTALCKTCNSYLPIEVKREYRRKYKYQ